jgi:ribose-phosphate pyrophosphokinase
MWLFY